MMKKFLAAAGVAAVLILGGSSAAIAYPAAVTCTATPATVTVGSSVTIQCSGLIPGDVTLTLTGPGVVAGDLASIVLAAGGGSTSVTKTVGDAGTVSAVATPKQAGTFTVSATDSQENTGSVTFTATAASTGGLPVTGGSVPAAAIWLGVGVIGLGGIAVAAAAARRRAQNR